MKEPITVLEALDKLKYYRDNLRTYIKEREHNLKITLPKGVSLDSAQKTPHKYDFIVMSDIEEKIDKMYEKINELREKILITNALTKVDDPLYKGTLGKLKLKIDEITSELAVYERFHQARERYGFTSRLTSDDMEIEHTQIPRYIILEKLETLKNQKRKYQGLLNKINQTTHIITELRS